MEAVMGEAGEGNKAEGYSVGETGGTRINGEVNGSIEEAMDVCDVPRHDTIMLKKVSSVMSDKSLDDISSNSLSDNVSCSSKEFDNKDNDSDGGTGRGGDKVPISEPADTSRELGTEVPGSEEMDVDDEHELNDSDGNEHEELKDSGVNEHNEMKHGVDNEDEESKDSGGNECEESKDSGGNECEESKDSGGGNECEESKDSGGNECEEFKDGDERSRISVSIPTDKDGVLSDAVVDRNEESMDCDVLSKSDVAEAQEGSIEDPLLDKIDSNLDSDSKPEKVKDFDEIDTSEISLGGNDEEEDCVSKIEVDKEADKRGNSKNNDSLCEKIDTVSERDCDSPEIIPECDPLAGEPDNDENNESDPLNNITTNNSSDISGELVVNEDGDVDGKCERNDRSTGKEKSDSDSPRCTSPVDEKSNDSSKLDAKQSAEGGENTPAKNSDKDETDLLDVSNSDSKTGESPGKVKKSRKSATLLNLTPRRSSRNLNKQKSYVEKEEDPDIQEITPVDPLADPLSTDPLRDDKENSKARNARKNTIVVNDTKRLVEIAAGSKGMKGGKKEPTLVIIDTNSILSGRGPVPVSQGTPSPGPSSSTQGYSVLPVALPAQGMYPPTMRVTATPVPPPPPPVIHRPPPPPPPPQILPSLTDDMYVVEAPSFIVPYVYEKPPNKPLKNFIDKLGKQLQEIKEREEKEELAKKAAAEKAAAEKAAAEKAEAEEKAAMEKAVTEKAAAEKAAAEKVETEKNDEVAVVKEKDDAQKEGTEGHEEKEKAEKYGNNAAVDPLGDAKVVDKEKEHDIETVDKDKNSTESVLMSKEDSKESKEESTETSKSTSKDQDKSENKSLEIVSSSSATNGVGERSESKPEGERVHRVPTYFDNPLGKFFSQIGVNLVQEYVQTELLRSQRRKRDREGGKGNATTQFAINSLLKNLEFSKENNEPFHLDQKKCEYCSFKTESNLVMAQHLETPHMRNYVYRCNFCPLEVRSPHDILFHMEAEHNVRGRLERAPAFHQCPNCPFEDNQKGKLTRHLMSCTKKHKAEKNQEPPPDWEPPAKIPRIARSRPTALGLGAAAYQAMAAKQNAQHPLLPKLIPGPAMPAAPGTVGRGRGRPPIHGRYMPPEMKLHQQRPIAPTQIRQGMMYRPSGPTGQPQVLLPATYQIAGNQIYQSANNKNPAAKLLQQPSISITPLPRQPTGMPPGNSMHTKHTGHAGHPGHPGHPSKATFVICEICDGYIKDLEQLRNHMQWIHKVKIHPKMIYNRPPLNCQKCQFRFFTDQGLERHLLGSHGLVTSSMQEAANKGKDGGRCPVCGRVYQWKLLNHVARDHNMSLKPAHLSYKCTVCTATFGMYKQFENHVYSAHSVVAKRVMDKKSPQVPRPQSSETLLKPLKINDEITIIPQPARPRPGPASRTGAVSAMMQASLGKVYSCEKCEATFDGQTGFTQYLSHIRRRHLRRCSVKLCRLEDCPTCKRRHTTQSILDYIEDHKSGVDVIELSDDEVVIAGQGRNEITITKVPCAPGPKRFKQRFQQRHNVQVIELEDSPVKNNKNADGNTSRENGEDSLNAVKERLRRRKSLEISQVDSECSSPQSSDDMPAKKRRRNDDE